MQLAAAALAAMAAEGALSASPARAATTWYYPHTQRFTVTSPYGYRIHPITGVRTFHDGVDIGSPLNRAVYAMREGQVVVAGVLGGYGNFVRIQHPDGSTTGYGHLSVIRASNGQRVSAGTRVGDVGSTGNSTGPHLHVEYTVGGRSADPGSILSSAPLAVPGGVVTPPIEEKELGMAYLINDGSRGALVGPGYFGSLNSEEFGIIMGSGQYDVKVINAREFDVTREAHNKTPVWFNKLVDAIAAKV